jgi:hypothetical protein
MINGDIVVGDIVKFDDGTYNHQMIMGPMGLQNGIGRILKFGVASNNIKFVSISVPSSGGPFVIFRKSEEVEKVSDEDALLWKLENL